MKKNITMATRKDIVNIDININGDKGKKELNDLRSKSAQLTSEMKSLKKNTAEWIAKNEELKKINARMDELKSKIGLTAMSQRELIEELKRLQAQKNFLTPQTAEFKKLQQQIDMVQDRLRDVRTGKFGLASFWGGLKSEVKQFGALALGYLGFDFIMGQTRNIIQMQTKMSKEYADIQKTTSLSVAEVKQLDESLRSLDTPTSNSRLRVLAAEAGKLGIDGVADIKKFVEEADKIEVALGEELGEEGLLKIAKLSSILKEGMTNIASGINSIGQSSAASESYQVDFAFRMAGTAQTAKIAAGDLLGFASALEVNGQTAEVAGTALSTFMLDFVSKTEEMGAVAGFAKGELTSMLNGQGANAAFVAFLQKMKETSATTDEFINKMRAVGVDGARGAGVFLVLAENLGLVKEQQLLANDAISAGTSVLDEFEVGSQTFDAVVRRLQKQFNAFFTSDAVNNGVKKIVYALEGFLNVIKVTSEWISRNSTAVKLWIAITLIQTQAIQRLITFIAIKLTGDKALTFEQVKQTIATKADIVWKRAQAVATAILTGNVRAATVSFRAMTAAMMANPFTAILAGISVVLVALDAFKTSTTELSEAQRRTNEIMEESATSAAKEVSALDKLYAAATDTTKSIDERTAAVLKLQAEYPSYFGNMSKEIIMNGQARNSYLELREAIISASRAKAYQKILDERNEERVKDEVAKREWRKYDKKILEIQGNQGRNKAILSDYEFEEEMTKLKEAQMKEDEELLGLLEEENAKSEKYRKDLEAKNKKLQIGGVTPSGSSGAGSKKSKADEALKDLEKLKEEMDNLAEAIQRKKLAAEDDILGLHSLDLEEINEKFSKLIARAKGDMALIAELKELKSAEILNLDQETAKKLQQQSEKSIAKMYDDEAKLISDKLEEQQQALAQDYANGLIWKGEYEQGLSDLESASQESRLALAQEYADIYVKAKEDEQKLLTEIVKKGIAQREQAESDEITKLRIKILKTKAGSKERLDAEIALAEKEHEAKKKSKVWSATELEELELLHDERLKEIRSKNQEDFVNSWKTKADLVLEVLRTFGDGVNNIFAGIAKHEDYWADKDRRRDAKRSGWLKERLDKGLISQKEYDKGIATIEAEAEKRDKELKHKQAKRDKAMRLFQAITGTAQAVINALSSYMPPLNMIMAGIVGGLGAVQIGLIASQPIPKGKKGLVIDGPSHSEGGISMYDNNTGRALAEIEGGEPVMVLSRNTYSNNKPLIDELIYNSNYKNGARVAASNWFMKKPASFKAEMMPFLRSGGVVGQGSSSVDRDYTSAFDLLLLEQQKTRKAILAQKQSSKAYVVLQDVEYAKAKKDRIKKISGLWQK